MMMCEKYCKDEHNKAATVAALTRAGGASNLFIHMTREARSKMLLVAAAEGQTEVIQDLLQAGADVEIRDAAKVP